MSSRASKQECAICYQCGTCTSSCPSGRELYRGPRRIVRLILAGEIGAVLKSDDLWRCTECGTCTLGLPHGYRRGRRPAQAAAARTRARRHPLRRAHRRRRRDDAPQEAAAHRQHALRRGHGLQGLHPEGQGRRRRAGHQAGEADAARAARRRPAGEALPADSATLPFYAGCAIPQDHELHAVVHEVAAGFGVHLDESADAGCCGHPSRGAVDGLFASGSASTRRAPPATPAWRRPAWRRSRCGTRSPSAPAAPRLSR